MSETVKGKTLDEARAIIDNYVSMVKGEGFDESVDLGEAVVYQGVSNFPARIKCSTISWNALSQSIEEKGILDRYQSKS